MKAGLIRMICGAKPWLDPLWYLDIFWISLILSLSLFLSFLYAGHKMFLNWSQCYNSNSDGKHIKITEKSISKWNSYIYFLQHFSIFLAVIALAPNGLIFLKTWKCEMSLSQSFISQFFLTILPYGQATKLDRFKE